MATSNFDQLLERVKYLPPEEQKILRDHLDACLTSPLPPARGKEEEWLRRAMASGSILQFPSPLTDDDLSRLRNWKPIKIEGEPLSETIIRERR